MKILKKLFNFIKKIFDSLFLAESIKKLKEEKNSNKNFFTNNKEEEKEEKNKKTVKEEEELDKEYFEACKEFEKIIPNLNNKIKIEEKEEKEDIFLNFPKNFGKNKRKLKKNIYQFSKFKLNNAIIKIVDELGKKKQSNSSKKNGEYVLSYENIEDIKIGNDIPKIIPNELLKLALNETEMQFYNDFYEKKLFEYEYEKIYDDNKNKNLMKGDIICCLDVSGSMEDSPIRIAVNIIQEIISKLIKEKRKFYLILFREEIIKEKLIKSLQDFENLISYINLGGGTDFFSPIQRAIELVKEKKENDILFISDGCFESDLKENFKNFYKQKKEINFKIHSIIIDEYNDSSKEDFKTVNQFSDKIYYIDIHN